MAAHPMSFADVLQDEYRYFFDEVPLQNTTVELKEAHVRELADFARKLLMARDQNLPNSRFALLGRRAFEGDGPHDGAAVLTALNKMLRDENLLRDLIAEEPCIAAELAPPAVMHALLAVPHARLLMLREQAFRAAIARDEGVLPRFASHSAAVRLLVAEGGGDLLLRHPELLSRIADDERVDQALSSDPAKRDKLRRLFAAPKPASWFARFRRAKPQPQSTANAEMPEETLLAKLDISDRPVHDLAIPIPQLTHFNALILENVYGNYVSDGVTMREIYRALHAKEMSALCLSGGGIRSATFGLGILQGLADHRMLNRFNYVSTVSGGGYIGSWLSSWIRRHNDGPVGVATDLVREPIDPLEPEVKPIRHLREYSSYLAPQSSAFSVDSWTLLATYLRNLLLNWTMLLPAMAALLALPRLEASLLFSSMSTRADWPGVLATFSAFFAVLMVGILRPKSDITARRKRVDDRSLSDDYDRYLFWLVPMLISSVLFTLYWASPNNLFAMKWWVLPALFTSGSVFSAIVHVTRRAAATVAAETRWQKTMATFGALFTLRQQGGRLWREIRAAAFAGMAGGTLMYATFITIFPLDRMLNTMQFETYLCTALPLYFFIFFIEATLLVGFTTQTSSDHDREWWARSAATMFLVGAAIAALSFTVVILPILILQSPKLLAPVGGISGAISWLLQKKLKSSKSKDGGAMPLMMALHVAAAITMAFVLAAISIGTSYAMKAAWPVLAMMQSPIPLTIFGTDPTDATGAFIRVLRYAPTLLVAIMIAIALEIAVRMSTMLDVNLYSMHAMYRSRLVRAYLGASRWRRNPNAFTGFDPQDDLRMADLRPEALWPSCIVNFDALLAKLMSSPHLLKQLPPDVQERVKAFVGCPNTVDREALKAAVVNAINELMPSRDLEHDVEAPPSLDLFLANRKFLNRCFEGALKCFGEELPPDGRENAAAPIYINDDDDAATRAIKHELSATAPAPLRGRAPLHIVNAALNLVGGTNLAWQERKAASFTISPLHSGSRLLCYRDSAVYAGGVTLGTALAISGAAVSPNMGALSSPTFTFLMTLFNARLGWWLGNPKTNEYEKVTPTSSITAFLREARGKTDETHPFVFLSDGGHFENLGIYEMVARRCKYIVACDATADGKYAFGDLANAVRKIRIDMGIPIEQLTTQYIRPEAGEKHGKYCAMGEIRYGSVDGGDARGYLLYIKPALREDCPADVRNYGRESESFPHESTVDQFFSESQFESYRELGRHILGEICGTGVHRKPWVTPNVAAFFGKAYAYINKVQPGVGDRPVASMNDIVGWMRDGL